MNDCQNFDKLDNTVRSIIRWCFEGYDVHGFARCTAVEVRLDDPLRHMANGGEGSIFHGGSCSPKYMHHIGDPDWAIVRVVDETWKAYVKAIQTTLTKEQVVEMLSDYVGVGK